MKHLLPVTPDATPKGANKLSAAAGRHEAIDSMLEMHFCSFQSVSLCVYIVMPNYSVQIHQNSWSNICLHERSG